MSLRCEEFACPNNKDYIPITAKFCFRSVLFKMASPSSNFLEGKKRPWIWDIGTRSLSQAFCVEGSLPVCGKHPFQRRRIQRRATYFQHLGHLFLCILIHSSSKPFSMFTVSHRQGPMQEDCGLHPLGMLYRIPKVRFVHT